MGWRSRQVVVVEKKRGCGCTTVLLLGFIGFVALGLISSGRRRDGGPAPSSAPSASASRSAARPSARIEETPRNRPFTRGSVMHLGAPGMRTVWVATSDAAWTEMLDAQNQAKQGGEGNLLPLAKLIESGRVLQLEAGTRARVVDVSATAYKVLVLDGPAFSREGWIQRELTSP